MTTESAAACARNAADYIYLREEFDAGIWGGCVNETLKNNGAVKFFQLGSVAKLC